MEFRLNQYLILGHRYRYDRFQQEYLANPNSQNDALLYIDNPFDTTITSHNDISVVLDNNTGRFVYIGKIYAKSVGDFIDLKIREKINRNKTRRIEMASTINSIFNRLKVLSEKDITLYFLSHNG